MKRAQHIHALVGRVRRQRRRRGAAMVEGLVVIPFFMLIFVGTMFIGGFFAKRIHLQNHVREETWRMAVSENCDGKATGSLKTMDVVDSSDLGELSASPLAALCDKDFGSVSYTAKDSHNVNGFNGKIHAAAMVPCNETPIPGDVAYESAVNFLWDAYQSEGTIPANADPPTAFPIELLFGGTGGIGGVGGIGTIYAY